MEPNISSIREQNLRVALINAYHKDLAEFLANARGELLDELLAKYEAEGTKSFSVLLPGGGKVGNITLPESKGYDEQTDLASLHEWAEPLGGIITETVPEVPAVPARTTKRLDRAWLENITETAVEGEGGALIDPTTGEVIPGIKRHPATVKTSFTVTYTKTGRDELAQAYLKGELNGIADGSGLPMIEQTKDAS